MHNKKIIKLYIYNALINFSLVSIVQNLYLQHIGFDLLQIGILLAILQISKMLLEIPTGYVADKYGSSISVVVSLIVQIIAYFFMQITNNFFVMSFALILLACGSALTSGCVEAILIDCITAEGATDQLPKIYSINRIIQYVSCGLAGIVAGILAERNYSFVFWTQICTLGICLTLILGLDSHSNNAKSQKNIGHSFKDVFGYIITRFDLFYFILISSAIAWAMIPVDDFYTNYLSLVFNLPLSTVGFIVAIQFMLVSVLGIYSKKIELILGKQSIIRLGPIVMMFWFLLFSIVSLPFFSIIFYSLGLSTFCIYSPLCYECIQTKIKSEYRVTVLSTQVVVSAALSAVSQPLMGIISDTYGLQTGMRILILISLVFLVLINLAFHNLNFGKTSS